ncbi:hypothetical protein RND81_04G156000 [Saponaria officinalis]|uniref:protein-serine/threonine phosphatase n=1 Tax=Saponaria officinalis TaxID=3572 RepID=A0AAW1LJQ6_SAPOF
MSVTISNSHNHHYHQTSIYSSSSSSLSPHQCSPSSTFSYNFSINPFRRSFDAAAVTVATAATVKRKRPSMLVIPIVPLGFDASTSKNGEEVDVVEEGKNGSYSVYCKKGRRAFLEDRFSVELDIHGDSKQAIFGVFDGHGGAKAAEYAAKNLNKNIIAEVVRLDDADDTEAAIKQGYLKTDSDFLEGELQGGSCCITALITKGHLVVSNAGDCRAVMSRGGVAEALTTDHRPSRPDEKDRIEIKGGYIDCFKGVWRIQGSLAVSRGIGDRQLKQWVIAEPETKSVKISSNDEFVILASDGLWEKVTNQEAVDIIRPLCIGNDKPLPITACKKLVDMAVSRGSVDDISVMIIPLAQYMQ